jgi:hypothetical protein
VPEQIPDRLKIDALGKEQRDAGVSKIMKSDSGHAGSAMSTLKVRLPLPSRTP